MGHWTRAQLATPEAQTGEGLQKGGHLLLSISQRPCQREWNVPTTRAYPGLGAAGQVLLCAHCCLATEPQRSVLQVGRVPRRFEIEKLSCLESKQKVWKNGCYLTTALPDYSVVR